MVKEVRIRDVLKDQLIITDRRAEFLEELILEALADQCPNWDRCREVMRDGGY